MDGGAFVAEVLKAHKVPYVFTLCGGHISPILVGCKRLGIKVIDVRHEVNAVFAADAVSRLTGIPGVAVVTAGPGVTNAITAVKNAQMAQSPLILIGGASATVLRGRGSLQDIDQMPLIKPHVKAAFEIKLVKDIAPALEEAFQIAQEGVPGPVFVETPIDLLYPQEVIREWYGVKGGDMASGSLMGTAVNLYLKWHTDRMFKGVDSVFIREPYDYSIPKAMKSLVVSTANYLEKAKKPVMVLGSQALLDAKDVDRLVASIEQINIPVYLSGVARGLLGKDHPLQLRHKRTNALKGADLVILAGVPCDFRLDYGNHINRKAKLVTINRDPTDLVKNRRPFLAALGDPGTFLKALSREFQGSAAHSSWLKELKQRDEERNSDITRQAHLPTEYINPIHLCQRIEAHLDEESVIIADGGDFVATASYTLQPRKPLSWLDPGVFGTLGVGGGFAVGAALCRPGAEIWLIYGDGSCAYSLAEFDTFVRHGLGCIAVIGNDASWAQIARDQVDILHDDVATVLRYTDYHKVAQGYGGEGLLLDDPAKIDSVLKKAKELAKQGKPVVINALIGKTDFRKGSISV